MSAPLTAQQVLIQLGGLRDSRYDAIHVWIRELHRVEDTGEMARVGYVLSELEKVVYQCQALDHLLHDVYNSFEQASRENYVAETTVFS